MIRSFVIAWVGLGLPRTIQPQQTEKGITSPPPCGPFYPDMSGQSGAESEALFGLPSPCGGGTPSPLPVGEGRVRAGLFPHFPLPKNLT